VLPIIISKWWVAFFLSSSDLKFNLILLD